MDAMIEKQREYEAARRECEKRLQEIRFFIGLLDSYVERTVCEYRYLSYYGWLEIGIELNYSLSALERVAVTLLGVMTSGSMRGTYTSQWPSSFTNRISFSRVLMGVVFV